ncbi:peptide MFS transporter [Haliangium sp.]|uniref:peptide MFS transporter n=1 Tax=Haliangium sp. TaxID=2663208 RepID=UPI003D0D5E0B
MSRRQTSNPGLVGISEVEQSAAHRAGGLGGHPKGLWVIFITEMWERFSYYGMRALLVLYLVAETSGENPGFGWDRADASTLYGWYTGAVYLTPIAGGWLADRFLGTHRSILIGGWIIAAGHVCLALTELFGTGAAEVITLQAAPGPLVCFMAGLALIIIGTGVFKPCASVMVGQLYGADDPRRDSGFTIFYMGVNVGATLAGLVAGTLGEQVGWHWGFGSAAVGMILGLLVYQALRDRYLGNIGLAPGRHRSSESAGGAEAKATTADAGAGDSAPLTRVDWERIAVILILASFGIAFWVAFEQAGSSLNLFAAESTDRVIAGWEFPATWYQSANPTFIVLLAPVLAWLWVWLDRRGLQPPTPVKFGLGLAIMSFGCAVMIPGALEAESGLAGPQWLLLLYLLHTTGELCLSPVALSMVTKLSPPRYTSLMMGLYYGSFAIANIIGGYVAASAQQIASGKYFVLMGGQADFFLALFILPMAAGLAVLALSPVLKRMMHGRH